MISIYCDPGVQPIVAKIGLINVGLIFLYMSLWFLVAYRRKRIDTVDISWGLGFVVIALSSALIRPSARTITIAVLVSIWGLRLAHHIYKRSKTKGEDPRYIEIASKWKGNYWFRAYASVFLVQGLLILAVGLPIVVATGRRIIDLRWLTVVGALIWLTGFIIEALADRQLAKFLQDKNHPKVLKTGLWKYSRHPNYFGELTQWWGIGVIALQVHYGWIGLFGPLLLSLLIIFVSGIPPIEKRRLKDPAYKKYKLQTSALIPWPPKKS